MKKILSECIIVSKEIDNKNLVYLKILKRVDKLQSKIHQCNRDISDFTSLNAMARKNTIKVAGYVFFSTILVIFYLSLFQSQ
jgi:hypothetical protein